MWRFITVIVVFAVIGFVLLTRASSQIEDREDSCRSSCGYVVRIDRFGDRAGYRALQLLVDAAGGGSAPTLARYPPAKGGRRWRSSTCQENMV